MSKAKTAGHSQLSGEYAQGRSVAALGRGMALDKIGKTSRGIVRPEDHTTVLVKKVARALNKPGIDKPVVFCGPNAARIFSYSVDPKDMTKVVRESADGSRVIGRLVGGHY